MSEDTKYGITFQGTNEDDEDSFDANNGDKTIKDVSFTEALELFLKT